MKKIVSLFTTVTLAFAFAGCSETSNTVHTESSPSDISSVGTDSASSDTESQSSELVSENQSKEESKTVSDTESNSIVIYFSRTGEQYSVGVIEKGNTSIVADMIAEYTGAEHFEILPKNDTYPTTYKELTQVAKEEQNIQARPEIQAEIPDFADYDTVYFGYPIWWGDLPMICYTFLESYDFSGKTVVPFCTHAGSGTAGTQSKIQSVIPDADVKEVFAVTGADTQNSPDTVRNSVNQWLSNLEE